MRLLLFAYSYLPKLGGEQIEFEMMLKELDKTVAKDWDVHFIAPNIKSRKYCSFKNISTHYLDLNFDGIQGKKRKKFFGNILTLTRLLKKIKPDVIHSLSIIPGSFMMVLARMLSGSQAPLIISSHGADLTVIPEIKYGTRLNPLFNALSKVVVKFEKIHQVPSTAMKPFCKEINIPKEKVLVIPNSIPDDKILKPKKVTINKLKKKLNISDKDCVFLSLSGFREVKGMSYLLEGFIQACKKNPRVKLLLASKQNNNSKKYLQLIKKHKLENNIVFIGKIGGEVKEAYFSIAHAFIMPSIFESFGIALIEAMQRGKICIATNAGGMKDIIEDGKNGYLIPVKSSQAIKNKVLWVSGHYSSLSSIEKEAIRKAETYKMSKVIKEFINMYKQAVEGKS